MKNENLINGETMLNFVVSPMLAASSALIKAKNVVTKPFKKATAQVRMAKCKNYVDKNWEDFEVVIVKKDA